MCCVRIDRRRCVLRGRGPGGGRGAQGVVDCAAVGDVGLADPVAVPGFAVDLGRGDVALVHAGARVRRWSGCRPACPRKSPMRHYGVGKQRGGHDVEVGPAHRRVEADGGHHVPGRHLTHVVVAGHASGGGCVEGLGGAYHGRCLVGPTGPRVGIGGQQVRLVVGVIRWSGRSTGMGR